LRGTVEFNYYSKSDYGQLVLMSSSEKKTFLEKNVNLSMKGSKSSSWELLCRMFLNIQKDYKVKN
jgi:hypothetical protein